MIATSAREEMDNTLEEERSNDAPTVFRLRPLTRRERDEVNDLMGLHAGQNGYPCGSFNTKVLRGGLAGWRNLMDQKGAEVPYHTERDGKVTDEALERLPAAVCVELANEILRRSTMSAADRKN